MHSKHHRGIFDLDDADGASRGFSVIRKQRCRGISKASALPILSNAPSILNGECGTKPRPTSKAYGFQKGANWDDPPRDYLFEEPVGYLRESGSVAAGAEALLPQSKPVRPNSRFPHAVGRQYPAPPPPAHPRRCIPPRRAGRRRSPLRYRSKIPGPANPASALR